MAGQVLSIIKQLKNRRKLNLIYLCFQLALLDICGDFRVPGHEINGRQLLELCLLLHIIPQLYFRPSQPSCRLFRQRRQNLHSSRWRMAGKICTTSV